MEAGSGDKDHLVLNANIPCRLLLSSGPAGHQDLSIFPRRLALRLCGPGLEATHII